MTEEEVLYDHRNKCWEEHVHFKETKDKIVFFIGTIFVTALFGSGILIFRSIELKSDDIAWVKILYYAQYVIMHLLFIILYLYYKYNGLKRKNIFSGSKM